MLKVLMPQRTKAQKIATEQKREAVQYSLPTVPTLATVPAKVVTASSDYSYVISDLKRIGVFTTLAFGAEIILKVILQTH